MADPSNTATRIVKVMRTEGEPLVRLMKHDRVMFEWSMEDWSHMISHITIVKPTGDDEGGHLQEGALIQKVA
jgi:hypothetical protein